ncbi:MAG TPA: hypothetical protein VFO89_09470 [Thermoanaerobaculia bacterium]|nr:hypothetical protein [Thermoanaerobaculia bacterium]
MTRASETCARDIAALRADVAAHDVRRFACEFQKDQIERERAQLPERMREHDELASLEHQVAKARLQAQLDEFEQARRARTAPNARASTTPNLDAERAAMERERALTDARRIVEDVSAEHIPMDARQPYHAFAGCVYLTERLNGATPADAAAHTRTVVADRIASGAEMTLNDRLAHKFQYDMLKPRLDGAAKTREGVVLLDALHKMGAGNGSERPA